MVRCPCEVVDATGDATLFISLFSRRVFREGQTRRGLPFPTACVSCSSRIRECWAEACFLFTICLVGMICRSRFSQCSEPPTRCAHVSRVKLLQENRRGMTERQDLITVSSFLQVTCIIIHYLDGHAGNLACLISGSIPTKSYLMAWPSSRAVFHLGYSLPNRITNFLREG